MKSLSFSAVILFISLGLSSCSTNPEPLAYGKDVCHFCKMTLMDRKFGAELVTKKGKIYKFDDLNCMLNYYHSGFEDEAEFDKRLVVDYANPGNLISASDALYVKSTEIRSPMNGGVAAFETKENMESFRKESNGIFLGWGEVVTEFK